MTRKHTIFSGRVQGAGLRYTSCYFAQSLGLIGWVKNLWDGDVEMEVQGDPKSVARLVEHLHEGRFIRIERMETEEIPVIKEDSFREIYQGVDGFSYASQDQRRVYVRFNCGSETDIR